MRNRECDSRRMGGGRGSAGTRARQPSAEVVSLPGCSNTRLPYNAGAVKSLRLIGSLALLLPALSAPGFSVRLFNESVAAKGEGDENPVDAAESKDQDDSPEDRESSPQGQLAPVPPPFEQVKRTARVVEILKSTPRPFEKHAPRSQRVIPADTRIERVMAQARCVSVSLAVVAPPVQSHAPPIVPSMV